MPNAGTTKADWQARREAMAVKFRAGMTCGEIAQQLGVSRQAVNFSLKKSGVSALEGGMSLRLVKKAAKRRIYESSRRIARAGHIAGTYGVTVEEYDRLRKKNILTAYWQKRTNAKVQNVAWELSLTHFAFLWESSNRWEQRGRRTGLYCLNRISIKKGFTSDNVYIGPFIEASSCRTR